MTDYDIINKIPKQVLQCTNLPIDICFLIYDYIPFLVYHMSGNSLMVLELYTRFQHLQWNYRYFVSCKEIRFVPFVLNHIGYAIITNDHNYYRFQSCDCGTEDFKFIPAPLWGVHHYSLVSDNEECLYLTGGIYNDIASNHMYQYNIVKKEWLPMATMNTSRRGHLSCYWNNCICVFAGDWTNSCEFYDTTNKEKKWVMIKDMPIDFHGRKSSYPKATVLLCNEHFLIVVSYENYALIRIYNPKDNTWNLKTWNIPSGVIHYVSMDDLFILGFSTSHLWIGTLQPKNNFSIH